MAMKRACIIGAGPVGCALGVMLRRRGIEVDIYERYQDIRVVPPPSGRSINLVLTKRGIRLAKSLGLEDQLLKVTVKVTGRMIHPMDGENVYQAYGRDGECNYSIDRSILNKFWLSQAEKEGCFIHFDQKVDSFDITSGDLVFVGSEGRKTTVNSAGFSAIFGSDGGGSIVRSSLAAQGLVNSEESLLPAGYKEVVFPSKPDGGYLLDPNSLHIWARDTHMMMALANADGSFTGTIYMDRHGSDVPSFETVGASESAALDFLSKFYADALAVMDKDSAVSNLVSFKEGILGTVRCHPWAVTSQQTPVCLIGDAAHAIVPFFGQGVNCGLEDVLVLQELIERHGNLASAISAFSDSRKKDSDAIADLALENFDEMRSKVGDDRFRFLKQLDTFIMNKLSTVYRTRYTLIMYSPNSYSQCKALGEAQHAFLEVVVKQLGLHTGSDLEKDVDLSVVSELIHQHISPVVAELGISFDY